MTDRLLALSQNPQARKLVQSLGLPLPLPENLRRGTGAWVERPLHDHDVLVATAPGGELAEVLAPTLTVAGANPLLTGDASGRDAYREAGEAHGRPPRALDDDGVARVHGIVVEATGLATPSDLGALYELLHAPVRALRRSGRVVVLGRPAGSNAATAATRRALEGFVRSLAKEVGRRGATVQLITVAEGAEARLEGPLRWVLSARSAFVTGQPIAIDATAKASEVVFTQPLDGKVALVTGAARGIGKATAKRLAEEGADVLCLDRPADDGPCSQIAREVGGRPLLVDVSADDAPQRIVDGLGDRGVDIVIHNAGVTRDKTLAKMDRARWDQCLDINLGAVTRITEALLEGSLRDGGRVVCLSSVAGIAGNMGQTNYAASKAGILGYVEALAPQLADRGITVNAIAPGFIETRLTAAIPTVIREVGRRLSALSQGGLPVDVAEAITFLASPGSHGVTGRTLRVCGGAFIGA